MHATEASRFQEAAADFSLFEEEPGDDSDDEGTVRPAGSERTLHSPLSSPPASSVSSPSASPSASDVEDGDEKASGDDKSYRRSILDQ